MKVNISTVNVIEMLDGDIMQLIAFDDTETGVKDARDTFMTIITEHENNLESDDLIYYLDMGIYENNGYQLFIVYSI